ncbi:uncharacterized protein VTP21DRAFT_4959 [Calcarisporiella thermophila]|uniref:uncharacterized protein n=1 Tax=Calcarisporiella thermophila TaxID=911321 RepID=UPI0037447163
MVSMPGKRKNPFDEICPLNKQKGRFEFDWPSIYARTNRLLFDGQRQIAHQDEGSQSFPAGLHSKNKGKAIAEGWKGEGIQPWIGACYRCRCAGCSLRRCDFCEHPVCSRCLNMCVKCQGSYCGVCSTISYDAREEQVNCLSCS